jgi:uncharacterized membrane protein YhhN
MERAELQLRSILISVICSVGLYSLAEFSNIFTPIVCALLKAFPAILCAFGSYRCLRSAQSNERIRHSIAIRYCTSIILGLIFCALGDFFLRLDKINSQSDQYFLLGLVSFFLGHLLFIIAFWLDGGNGLQVTWGVLIYTYMAVYLFYILSKIPEEEVILRGGVVAYCIIIGTMCHRSISLSFDAYPKVESTLYATYGSVLFVVSDSLLAYNRFINPVPYDFLWVLGTYFLAISFIASSSAGCSRWGAGWQ